LAVLVGDAEGLASVCDPPLELAQAVSDPAATVIVAIPVNQRRRMIFPPVLDIDKALPCDNRTTPAGPKTS
jgi:hypothetical protein